MLPWPGSPPDLNPLDYITFPGPPPDPQLSKTFADFGRHYRAPVEAHNEFDRRKINSVIDAFPGRLRRSVDGEEKLGASEGVSGFGAGYSVMDVDK